MATAVEETAALLGGQGIAQKVAAQDVQPARSAQARSAAADAGPPHIIHAVGTSNIAGSLPTSGVTEAVKTTGLLRTADAAVPVIAADLLPIAGVNEAAKQAEPLRTGNGTDTDNAAEVLRTAGAAASTVPASLLCTAGIAETAKRAEGVGTGNVADTGDAAESLRTAGIAGAGKAATEGSEGQQGGLRLDLSSEEDPLLCTQRLPSSQGVFYRLSSMLCLSHDMRMLNLHVWCCGKKEGSSQAL